MTLSVLISACFGLRPFSAVNVRSNSFNMLRRSVDCCCNEAFLGVSSNIVSHSIVAGFRSMCISMQWKIYVSASVCKQKWKTRTCSIRHALVGVKFVFSGPKRWLISIPCSAAFPGQHRPKMEHRLRTIVLSTVRSISSSPMHAIFKILRCDRNRDA